MKELCKPTEKQLQCQEYALHSIRKETATCKDSRNQQNVEFCQRLYLLKQYDIVTETRMFLGISQAHNTH